MLIFSTLCFVAGLAAPSVRSALLIASALFVASYLIVFAISSGGLAVRMPTGLHAAVPVVLGLFLRWLVLRLSVAVGGSNNV